MHLFYLLFLLYNYLIKYDFNVLNDTELNLVFWQPKIKNTLCKTEF